MATILLVIIYIGFMGMGVPDSLFGAAWPAIYAEMGIPVGWASYITMIISAGTVMSSLFATKVILRFGTGKVTLVSTVMTAVSLLGFSLSHYFIWLCVCSVPIGFGAGAVDAALNNYVSLHYKASHMNFMQCFYGIGVALSPYLMSLALESTSDWHNGYRMAFFLQAGIATVLLFSLPLWKKVKHQTNTAAEHDESSEQIALPLHKQLKDRNIRIAAVMCFATCGIEFICAGWASTFFVEARNFSVEMGAKLVIGYYLGVTIGRFLAGMIANKIGSWNVMKLALAVTFFGVVMLFIPSTVASVIGLFFLGFNAILAPNILYLTPEWFGEKISQAVTGTLMAAMYVGVLALPAFFGLLTKFLPVSVYPIYMSVAFIILICSTVLLSRGLKKNRGSCISPRE